MAEAGFRQSGAQPRSANVARLPVGLRDRKYPAPTATVYQADEARALAFLLMPFLLLAAALGISQSLKLNRPWHEASSATRTAIPGRVAMLPPLEMPRTAPVVAVAIQPTAITVPGSIAAWPPAGPLLVAPSAPVGAVTRWIPPARGFELAANAPVISLAPPQAAPAALVCRPAQSTAAIPAAGQIEVKDFGSNLASAAAEQTKDVVIYTARYQKIAFPMGDISPLFGACTDVIIRAYRSLGIDLQLLVQRARNGNSDANIDHRRTETLRSYFVRHAEVLPVSGYPEDYQPGDIVTYYRPFSRVSRAHIAMVSNEIGPSGRPLIIHNRGWGPQFEDALFVDKITGHYRLGAAAMMLMAAVPAKPAKHLTRTASFNPSINLPKPVALPIR